MDEHVEMVNRMGALRHACADGSPDAVRAAAEHLDALLTPHAHAEESGLFTVLHPKEEFTATIDRLIGEHRRIDELLAAVRADPATFAEFEILVRDHFDREENGLFPASAIELADGEWEEVHELTPPAA
jgi:hemerythrin-like domain-containing protein